MKKKIVVLLGGDSGERAISFQTGHACKTALEKLGYNVVLLDGKKNFYEKLEKIKPYKVFNALHGKYGEDGFAQSILEKLKIPYTHSGIFSSSVAMDKEISRIIFKKNKIRVPKYSVIKTKTDFSITKLFKKINIKFPVVLKPINEGSSLGVYVCKNIIKFRRNLKKLNHYSNVLVEEYISGKEIQVAVMGSKPLGAIELQPKRTFYDYKAKYFSSSQTKHVMPANLSKKNYSVALKLGLKAHKLLGCKGVTRTDFKFYKGKFYLLELNTQPGMTKLSLVPEIAEYIGISFKQLVNWIIKDASINR